MPLERVAAAAGTTTRRADGVVASWRRAGNCGDAAAALLGRCFDAAVATKAGRWAHLVPPPLARAAAGNPAVWALRGTASWSSRRWNGPLTRTAAVCVGNDPDPGERCCVAASPHCPPALLTNLAQDPEPEVRCTVAGNPSCPPGVLHLLAHDPESEEVYMAALLNDSSPSRFLAQFASDVDDTVRITIAELPDTQKPVLEQLEHDPRQAASAAV